MVFRFYLAVLVMLTLVPFGVMYGISAMDPEIEAGLDFETWLSGLLPVALGWVLFLAPGLIPFVGFRYWRWVGRTTGVTEATRSALESVRRAYVGIRHAASAAKARAAAIPGFHTMARRGMERLRRREETEDASQGETRSSTPVRELIPAGSYIGLVGRIVREPRPYLGKLRGHVDHLRERLTPDEMQRTIYLNQYTLEAFGHLKRTLATMLRAVDLDEVDRKYGLAVVEAIPEPQVTGDAERVAAPETFVYPEERRQELVSAAARRRISITPGDFADAGTGDLGCALLILSGVVARTFGRDERMTGGAEAVLLGVPVGTT